MTPEAYHLEPCHRTTARSPVYNAGMPPTPQPKGNPRGSQLRPRTFKKRYHTRILEPIHSQLLLCQKERWKAQTSTGLLTHQQVDQTKSKRIPANSPSH